MTEAAPNPVLGVLGGMGPAATTAFMARVQALTPAACDEDHVRMIVDLDPRVPNRHTAPAEAGRRLGRMAEGLKAAGATVLAMPCNTAHIHADAIRACGLPFIDMIDVAVVAACDTGSVRPGVLGTGGGRALYADRLRPGRPVLLDDVAQAAFMDLIFRIKAGEAGPAAKAEMAGFARALVDRGADAVIAGCTEIPLVLAPADVAVPLIDSAETLALACVAACAPA